MFGFKSERLGKSCYTVAMHLASLTKQGVECSSGKNFFFYISKLMPWLAHAHGCPRHLLILASVPSCHSSHTACYCFVMSAKIQRDPTSFLLSSFFFFPGKCNLQSFLSFVCTLSSSFADHAALVVRVRYVVTDVQGSLR